MTRLRLVFMGTPEFARVILEFLVRTQDYDLVGVYAQPDKPAGRGNKMTPPPVAVFAKDNGLPLFQPDKIRDPEALAHLQALRADFIVVAAYGKILPDAVLRAARIECLNVHASLLPKYRGAAPINYALMRGEPQTGVAIMRVVSGLDAGPVFLERTLAITDDDDAITLTDKLAHLGAQAIHETMREILSGDASSREQEHAAVTYAPKLDKSLSPIDWNLPARDVFNRVRALVPWPVAQTDCQGKRVKIFKTRELHEASRARPGTVVHIGKEGWTVATKDRNLLVTEVQCEDKKRMPAFDAANGMRLAVGVILGEVTA